MVETAKAWWQDNSTKFWRSLVLIIFGLLVFVYQREVYRLDLIQAKQVALAEAKAERAEVSKLADRVDAGFNRLSEQVAEVNRYLRNKGGG